MTEKFEIKYKEAYNFFGCSFYQLWGVFKYISPIEAFRLLALHYDEELLDNLLNELNNLLKEPFSEKEWDAVFHGDLGIDIHLPYHALTPQEWLTWANDRLCSIVKRERGMEVKYPFTYIAMGSPNVSFETNKRLQTEMQSKYPIVYQVVQNCLIKDCILTNTLTDGGYAARLYEYCGGLDKKTLQEGFKEVEQLKAEKHHINGWKRMLYEGFGMRYNLDYYEESPESIIHRIFRSFAEHLEE